jgi:alpha-tubulin suppressor-like RCC1 family protein
LGNNSTTSSSLPVAVITAGTPLENRTVVSMAAGGIHNVALCSDGTLVTWGENNYGQLGNNTTTSSGVPVVVTTAGTVLAGKSVIAVAAGQYHCLALCSDGTLVAWGYNTNGQLGNNTYTNSSVPVAVSSGVLAGKIIVALAAGYFHSMALCSDGTVAAWGAGVDLGDNSTLSSSVPVAVYTSMFASAERFMLVAAGSGASHSLGLVATPVPTVSTAAATFVTATSAVLNGTVNANGGSTNVSFDYGLDITYGMNVAGTPAVVTNSSATAVSRTLMGLAQATTYHFRVNGASGAASYNGADLTFTTPANPANLSSLVLSAGTLTPAFSPMLNSYHATVDTAVSSLTVTPGAADSQATITVNGMSVISGNASNSIPLGYGDNTINIVITASDTISTETYTLFVSRVVSNPLPAAYSSAADIPVTINGFTATSSTVNLTLNYAPVPGTTLTVVNNTGLGFINGTFSNLAQGQLVSLSYNGASYPFVASYYGGTGNDLVLVWAGNRPVAWGSNTSGKLGNNSTSNSGIPVAVMTAGTPLAGRTLLALSAGSGHSLSLFSDGTLASWGYNGNGELGNNTTTNSILPVAVITAGTPLAGQTVAAISAGNGHSLALCSDGTLATWGSNIYGELGNNTTTTHSSVPVAVTTAGTPLVGKSVVAISAGASHNLVLCSDGTLAAWGDNDSGQLGNGTTTTSNVPVAVTTAGTPLAGRTAVAMASGAGHNIVLCSDGSLVAWGANDSGQLGNNTTTSSNAPVTVTTAGTVLAGKTVIAVTVGTSHSLALCSDGTLAAWGDNIFGDLGNNSTLQRHVPVAVNTSGVLAGKTVIAISAGAYHSMALCADGTLAIWGYNGDDELGNSSINFFSSNPVAVDTSKLAPGERFMRVVSGSSSAHTLGLVASPFPAVTTLAATSVTASTAVLNGTVNAGGGTATVSFAVYFDYGLDSSYGTNVAGLPASVTDGSSTTVSTTLSGLTPNTTFHFRANGVNGPGTTNGADLTFTTLSQLQSWRQQFFGTTTTTGLLADSADYDGDGIPNLLEFALNLSPTAASKLPVATRVNGANFEYSYSRGSAAVTAGTTFTVEWSDTLAAGSWSSGGVTQVLLSDDGTTQQVKAVIPINATLARFVRLSVTAPP